jgi:Bacterial protein of unknown function (DUF899)
VLEAKRFDKGSRKMVQQIVTSEGWRTAREKLLAKEKEFSGSRDQVSRQRRDLPWEKVGKEYVFEGPDGKDHWPTYSRVEPSLSFTTSRSTLNRMRAASRARSSPTATVPLSMHKMG